MTRWLLYGLLAIITGAAIVLLISGDSGYILISLGHHSLEMSFWFGLIALTVLIYSLWILFKLFAWCRNTLAGSVSWISESRSKRIERRTSKGLMYFIEGNWRAAKKELLAAAKLDKKPLLQYLAAANSAIELDEEEETLFLLQQAEKVAPENTLAILLTKARLEIQKSQYELAHATLEQAYSLFPDDVVVLNLLKLVYLRLRAWTPLLTLLPKLKTKKVLNQKELFALEVEAWKGQISLALDKAMEMNTNPVASFDNVWKDVPNEIRKEASVVALYTDKLLNAGFQEKALNILAVALKHTWDRSLVLHFGHIVAHDIKLQLMQAESWLQEHPTDPDLLFILGKIAKENQLWGKAKDYLEKSLTLKASAYAYAELAGLLATLGKHQESVECYRKGLTLLNPTNYLVI